jgi:ribosomal protein S27E
MASCVMQCIKCGHVILQAEVEDENLAEFLLKSNPQLRPSGLEIECPNCKHRDKYAITDLQPRA